MKVKKFDNLWLMGIILCFALLITIYVFKIFFPSIVIEIAQIESITKIGHYIDTHKWAWYLASFIFGFVNYYFYCCACKAKYYLLPKECLIVFIVNALLLCSNWLLPKYYTTLNFISMILLPFILKGYYKNNVVCFTAINIVQLLTLEIRNISLMIINFNYATLMILMIDYYIFTILLYLLFNYKKGGYI